MLGDLSGVSKIYIVTGVIDMRKSIDGLMAIIRDSFEMDPYENAVYLFCGRKSDRIKAIHHERDGFCLLYKRLDSGRYKWPRAAYDVRSLTRQEFRWLMEGLSIDILQHAFLWTTFWCLNTFLWTNMAIMVFASRI